MRTTVQLGAYITIESPRSGELLRWNSSSPAKVRVLCRGEWCAGQGLTMKLFCNGISVGSLRPGGGGLWSGEVPLSAAPFMNVQLDVQLTVKTHVLCSASSSFVSVGLASITKPVADTLVYVLHGNRVHASVPEAMLGVQTEWLPGLGSDVHHYIILRLQRSPLFDAHRLELHHLPVELSLAEPAALYMDGLTSATWTAEPPQTNLEIDVSGLSNGSHTLQLRDMEGFELRDTKLADHEVEFNVSHVHVDSLLEILHPKTTEFGYGEGFRLEIEFVPPVKFIDWFWVWQFDPAMSEAVRGEFQLSRVGGEIFSESGYILCSANNATCRHHFGRSARLPRPPRPMPIGMMLVGLRERPPSKPPTYQHVFPDDAIVLADGLPDTFLLTRFIPLTYRHDSMFHIVPSPSPATGTCSFHAKKGGTVLMNVTLNVTAGKSFAEHVLEISAAHKLAPTLRRYTHATTKS